MASGRFTTYSLLWTDEGYIFYIDGKNRGEPTRDVCTRYIILSTNQDKGWAGDIPDPGYGTFDSRNIMYVDYVGFP